MKNSVKTIIVMLFLCSYSLESMIIKKNRMEKLLFDKGFLKQSKLKYSASSSPLDKSHLAVPNAYLKKWELTYKSDTGMVIEASKNLKKYGPLLYSQCQDATEKEDIKKLLQHNSLIAQDILKGLKKRRNSDCLYLAASGLGAFVCLNYMHEALFSYLFMSNSFLLINSSRNLINGYKEGKAYKDIVNFETTIKNYDEKQSQKSKDAEENKS